MSGLNKVLKSSSAPGISTSATKSSIATKSSVLTKSVSVATTTTSSVSPCCEYISRHKYLRDRRLITRNDIRQRMSVWSRLFAFCRGGIQDSSLLDCESIFTVRP
ncbi:unnamed protein product [Caenorhabditis nigoni]